MILDGWRMDGFLIMAVALDVCLVVGIVEAWRGRRR